MSQKNAQVSKLLTDVSLQVPSVGLIADQVLPPKATKQYSGLIGKYGEEHLRDEEDTAGGNQAFRRVQSIDYKDGVAYKISKHGLEDIVTDEDRSNVEDPFDAEVDKTTGLTQKVLIRKEVLCAAKFQTLSANVTLSGNAQWGDYANSNPIANFKNAHLASTQKFGVKFNAAVITEEMFLTLSYHPAILRNLGFADNRAGSLSVEDLKKSMLVDQLYIASGIRNTAAKGQSSTIGQIWGKDCFFLHRPASAALRQVSLGYRMHLIGKEGRQVYKYSVDNPPESTGILIQDSYDFVLTNTDAGYRIASAIA